MKSKKGQDIGAISSTSFVLLQAEWSVRKGLELIKGLGSTHVIVHSRAPHDAYFLYTKEAALSKMEGRDVDASLAITLSLKTFPATDQVDRATPVGLVSPRCVVIEEGSVIGFIDPNYRPRLTRGGQRGATQGGRRDVSLAETTADEFPFSLAAEFPEEIVRGETVSLLVYITPRPAAGPVIPIDLPPLAAVAIVVQVRRGFALVERGEGRLIVSAQEETLPLQFRLRGVSTGPGLIRVLAFHQGQSLGVLTLSPRVVEKSVAESTAMLEREQALAPASVRLPDLSLLILEEKINGSPALNMWVTDASLRFNFKKYGPIFLHLEPLRYFQEFFRDIESLPLGTAAERRSAKERLEAKGAHLFETLIPPELQAELWRLYKNERIISVQVQSEEPWIPWELCKMTGEVNGSVDEGRFFCEAFNITRWIPGVSRKQNLSLNKVALIVPQNSGLPYLPYALKERDYMLGLAGPGRIVDQVPATSLDVRRTLASGVYDGLHFSGHGLLRDTDPNRSAIILEEGGELTPEDLSGVARNLGQARPVAFLNAS